MNVSNINNNEEYCRPCEIATGLGFALDICDQEGIDCRSLEKLDHVRMDEEETIKHALRQFVKEIPRSRKDEARMIMCLTFSEDCDVLNNKEGS